MADLSPFRTGMDVRDINGDLTKEGLALGIEMPDGNILLCLNDNVSSSMWADIARLLGGRKVAVKGTWTFEPETNDA